MDVVRELDPVRGRYKSFVSVVIPCLNEEQTLGLVLAEIKKTLDASEFSERYEIVVADNGSTDRSREIAADADARVVNVPVRGYGAALQQGIAATSGQVIVMMDADFTYPSGYIPKMVSQLVSGSDLGMIIGSRLGGTIESGAMPPLHRYLGTPVLTFLVNRTWSTRLSDINSGMRVFWKSKFDSWQVTSPGMEFASELIVNCLENGDHIGEVPIVFRKDKRIGRPHLNTWGDGMRHLLFLLSRTPQFFVGFGLAGVVLSLVLMGLSMVGPFQIGPLDVFGMHTLVLAIIVGFLGVQVLLQGLFLDMNEHKRSPLTASLINIPESFLFALLAGLGVAAVGVLGFLFVIWTQNQFRHLAFLRLSLALAYLAVVLGSWAFGLLHLHIVKRIADERRRRSV